MTPIAPHISAFLKDRLPLQRGASEHTCDSYAYAFCQRTITDHTLCTVP